MPATYAGEEGQFVAVKEAHPQLEYGLTEGWDNDWSGINPGAPKLLNADFGLYIGVWTLAHGSTADLYQSVIRPEVASSSKR